MIIVEHLTKRYGPVTAVNDISFTVNTGTVAGFLGPNGAGKSTAMRCITGLTPPTSGHSTILGKPYHDLPNPGSQVGVLLDAGAMHPGRTGRETLTLAAITMGIDTRRVDEVLHLVFLSDAESKRRVGTYSLGMKQRLGLALALLGDPQVLILDEPANGLDPQGIVWMRDVLKQFAEDGGTVLLSSHLMHEVELIADHFIMIGAGTIVAQGTRESLLADGRSLESIFLELTAPTARDQYQYATSGGMSA